MLAPNISNVSYNAHVIKTAYQGTSNSTKATALGNNNADDDAAVAINQNPLRADTVGIQQNVHNGNAMLSPAQILKEAFAEVEGKMAEKMDFSVNLLTEEISPMTLGYKEVLATTIDKIAAKMKELWKVEIPSGSDVERDRANLNLTV